MKLVSLNYLYALGFCLTLMACGSSRKSKKTDDVPVTPAVTNKKFATTYSEKLGITVPETANTLLITTIAEWIGAPYKYGGSDKKGVDCSGFINNVYPLVYNISVPRVSAQIAAKASPVNKQQLKEGDLVFFKINTKDVGHAGIYLYDDYFVHASTSRGVMISRLNDTYWTKYYAGGGRFTK
jgi:lipoprotein Spr